VTISDEDEDRSQVAQRGDKHDKLPPTGKVMRTLTERPTSTASLFDNALRRYSKMSIITGKGRIDGSTTRGSDSLSGGARDISNSSFLLEPPKARKIRTKILSQKVLKTNANTSRSISRSKSRKSKKSVDTARSNKSVRCHGYGSKVSLGQGCCGEVKPSLH
jgi:hypothetical protein